MANTHFIYLLCFDRPLAHAKHYLGSTDDVSRRIERHARGDGGKLLKVAKAAGIRPDVVRVWRVPTGDARQVERRLKNAGGLTRRRPRCTPGTTWGRLPGTEDVPVAEVLGADATPTGVPHG